MWVRTTMTIKRWTKEKPEDNGSTWDGSSRDTNRLPSWERKHLLAGVGSSTDASTFSDSEFKDTDKCCWTHKPCTGHIIHPFTTNCAHNLHLHPLSHCDCDSRMKDCSEKANSSNSRSVGRTCFQDVGSTCYDIQTPCFAHAPEEDHAERYSYGWRKNCRPIPMAVIRHPIHHKYGVPDFSEDDDEEDIKPPIPTQVGPPTTTTTTTTTAATATTTTNTSVRMGTVMSIPETAAPITIWRSDSPTEKSQGGRIMKKKKKKETEKNKEVGEKAKPKKQVKKGKFTKKKSSVKSESSPPDLSRSVSPREMTRLSTSSPYSREYLESEDSYSDLRRDQPFIDDIMESSLSRKKEKNAVHAKKPGVKASPVKKVNKRKSPLVSNPN